MTAVKGLRAGFESELAERLTALSATDARALTERIHAECLARGFTYDREEGGRTAINFLPLPVGMTARERETLRRIGWTLRGILVRVLPHARADRALRELLPLEPGEEALLARVHAPAHDSDPAFLFRLDVDIDFTDAAWPEKAAFYEFNGSSVGGYHYSKVSETMIAGLVAEALGVPPPPRVVDGMPDLMLAVMRRQAERLGRRRLNIAYIEDREWTTGITEGPSLAEYFTRAGARAVVVDPRELSFKKGEVWAGQMPVDIVYRNMEMRDLVAIEKESGPLRAMEHAFAREQVVSSLWGDFDHKSLWEVLDTPAVLERLSGDERAFLRRHLPWTRILRPVFTRTPASERADLVAYVQGGRDHLVIKPNRGCGGAGVTLGPQVSAAEWDAAIETALREPGEWVVQTLVKNARRPFPLLGEDGRFHMEELFTAYGFLSSAEMFGCLGRASRGAVVNVSQGGGIFPVLSEA